MGIVQSVIKEAIRTKDLTTHAVCVQTNKVCALVNVSMNSTRTCGIVYMCKYYVIIVMLV